VCLVSHYLSLNTCLSTWDNNSREHISNSIRSALHIFVSATTTLLQYNLSSPSNPLAPKDLNLVEPLLTLLSALAQGGRSDEIAEMHRSCNVLFEKVEAAIAGFHHTNLDCGSSIPGMKYGDKEGIEDFLGRIEGISSGYDMEVS
jgi:hypothetical protein